MCYYKATGKCTTYASEKYKNYVSTSSVVCKQIAKYALMNQTTCYHLLTAVAFACVCGATFAWICLVFPLVRFASLYISWAASHITDADLFHFTCAALW